MVTQKKPWLSAIASIALIAVLGLTFAFTNNSQSPTKVADPVTYYFTPYSDTNTDIQNETNWTTSSGSLECTGETNLCQVTYDRSVYPTLHDYLLVNDTKSKIIASALSFSFKDQP